MTTKRHRLTPILNLGPVFHSVISPWLYDWISNLTINSVHFIIAKNQDKFVSWYIFTFLTNVLPYLGPQSSLPHWSQRFQSHFSVPGFSTHKLSITSFRLSGFYQSVFLKDQTAGKQRIKPDYEWGEMISLFIERMWRTAHFCNAVYVTADSTVQHESPVTASHHSSHGVASGISPCYMTIVCSYFLLFTAATK